MIHGGRQGEAPCVKGPSRRAVARSVGKSFDYITLFADDDKEKEVGAERGEHPSATLFVEKYKYSRVCWCCGN